MLLVISVNVYARRGKSPQRCRCSPAAHLSERPSVISGGEVSFIVQVSPPPFFFSRESYARSSSKAARRHRRRRLPETATTHGAFAVLHCVFSSARRALFSACPNIVADSRRQLAGASGSSISPIFSAAFPSAYVRH